MADGLENSGLFSRKNTTGLRILDRYKKIWGLRPFPIGIADFKMPRCAAQAQAPFGLTDHPPFRPIASRWLLKRLIADEMHFKVSSHPLETVGRLPFRFIFPANCRIQGIGRDILWLGLLLHLSRLTGRPDKGGVRFDAGTNRLWHVTCFDDRRRNTKQEKFMRHNAGFTFTELMVVIGIFSILSAIAVPNFLSWRTDAKLRGAVSNLKADLNLARLSAAREGQALAVTFETGLYQIFFDNGSGSGTADNWLPDGDEKMVRNRRLPAGVTLTNDVGGQLEFDARGLLPGGGGNLTLTDTSGQNVTLSLNRLGVITD